MNISEFKKVYPALRKTNTVPFLMGAQGVGKTQTIKAIAQDLGIKCVLLNLAAQEVGDLIGIGKDMPDGKVHYNKPFWFPEEGTEGIVFLDEINRAHPDVLQAMFPFVRDGQLHEHVLPKGWTVVAAGNYNNDNFNVTDMADAAWHSRFCYIDFKPSTEEFILHCENNEEYQIASFIRENPSMLQKKQKEMDFSFLEPNPRGYLDMIAKLEKFKEIEDQRFELYSGIIGTAAASAFMVHKQKKESVVSANDIVKNYNRVRSKILNISNPGSSRIDMLNVTTEELIALIQTKPDLITKSKENIVSFLMDIPKEMMVKFLESIKEIDNVHVKNFRNNEEICRRVMERLNDRN